MYAFIVSLLTLGFFLFPSFSSFAAVVPNDPLYPEQWYLQKIGASEAWDVTMGSSQVVVAVIDSGVDEDHEDLVNNFWVNEDEVPGNGIDDDGNGYVDDRNGWDFVLREPSFNPKFQGGDEVAKRPLGAHHGTIVAGIIAATANNGKGIVGVAPGVRLMPLRALLSSGRGEMRNVAAAIDYAVANGAQIINLSFETGVRSQLFVQALRRASERGVTIVAAAGNDGDDGGTGTDLDVQPLYPACTRTFEGVGSVIGVAATDRNDTKAPFSHFGSRCIDLAAPGIDTFSTVVQSPRFGFAVLYKGKWVGTSFATALVSGAAALLKSVDPTLTPAAIRRFLKEGASSLTTTDPVYGARVGAGRLDIARSLALLRSPQDRTRILASADSSLAIRPASFVFSYSNGREATRVSLVDRMGLEKKRWFPLFPSFRGAVHLVNGDLGSDLTDEIIVSAGKGGGPHVRAFNQDGELTGQFFAFEGTDRSGVRVAVGDPNHDGKRDVLAVSGEGRKTEARVFSSAGEQQLSFFPFGEEEKSGAGAASGDADGDGLDDFVFVTERSGEPRIRVTSVFGAEKFSFRPYQENVGQVSLALADVDGDGVMEIVTARGEGVPEVRVWKRDQLVANFFAYAPSFRGGVVVAGGDVDGDGRDEILAVPRSNGGPHVRVFSGDGVMVQQLFARERSWRGGMTAAVIR